MRSKSKKRSYSRKNLQSKSKKRRYSRKNLQSKSRKRRYSRKNLQSKSKKRRYSSKNLQSKSRRRTLSGGDKETYPFPEYDMVIYKPNPHQQGEAKQEEIDKRLADLAAELPAREKREARDKATRDCQRGDDGPGESGVSFLPLMDGHHVRLGSGKCLSRDDLIGQFNNWTQFMDRVKLGAAENPYNRQPFEENHKKAIEALLQGYNVNYHLSEEEYKKKKELDYLLSQDFLLNNTHRKDLFLKNVYTNSAGWSGWTAEEDEILREAVDPGSTETDASGGRWVPTGGGPSELAVDWTSVSKSLARQVLAHDRHEMGPEACRRRWRDLMDAFGRPKDYKLAVVVLKKLAKELGVNLPLHYRSLLPPMSADGSAKSPFFHPVPESEDVSFLDEGMHRPTKMNPPHSYGGQANSQYTDPSKELERRKWWKSAMKYIGNIIIYLIAKSNTSMKRLKIELMWSRKKDTGPRSIEDAKKELDEGTRRVPLPTWVWDFDKEDLVKEPQPVDMNTSTSPKPDGPGRGSVNLGEPPHLLKPGEKQREAAQPVDPGTRKLGPLAAKSPRQILRLAKRK